MGEVFPCIVQVLKVAAVAESVENLGLPHVGQVVLRVGAQDFFEAELSLGVVLLLKIDVRQFHPSFSVHLVHFQVVVQQLHSLLRLVGVSVHARKPLHCLSISRVLLQQFQVDINSLADIGLSLCHHAEHAHALDALRVLLSHDLQEVLGPVELLHVQGCQEELLEQDGV